MNTSYELVYDITQQPPRIWAPAFGLIFVALGVVLWLSRNRVGFPWRGSPGPRSRTLGAGIYLGFSVLWTVGVAVAVLGGDFAAQRALRSGLAGVVEGPVQDFHPMPYAGHGTERFRVGKVRFAYSDYDLNPGFNQTSSHGGPIRSGLMVRIHYTGRDCCASILRLEVGE